MRLRRRVAILRIDRKLTFKESQFSSFNRVALPPVGQLPVACTVNLRSRASSRGSAAAGPFDRFHLHALNIVLLPDLHTILVLV